MARIKSLNRVRVFSSTRGTGNTIAFGAAYDPSFMTFAEAGAQAGDLCHIVAEQKNGWALYEVTIGTAAASCTINAVKKSRIAGDPAGLLPLNLDGTQIIRAVEAAEFLDLLFYNDGTEAIASTGALIRPTLYTTNRGIDVAQTSPLGGTVEGPVRYNKIQIIHTCGITPAAGETFDQYGFYSSNASGFATYINTGGPSVTGTPVIAGDFRVFHVLNNSPSGQDFIGIGGAAYSNKTGGSLYGANSLAWMDGTGSGRHLAGMEVDVGIASTANADIRVGFRATAVPPSLAPAGRTASVFDAGFMLTTLSDDASAFENFFGLGCPDYGGKPIQPTGSFFVSYGGPYTIANFVNLPNEIFTGYLFNFQHAKVKGNGSASIGSAASAPTDNFFQFSMTGGGVAQLASFPNGAHGLTSVGARNSSGAVELDMVACEPSNTDTTFGIVKAGYAALLAGSTNGLLFGNVDDKPIIFGTGNAEIGRLYKNVLKLGTEVALPVWNTDREVFQANVASLQGVNSLAVLGANYYLDGSNVVRYLTTARAAAFNINGPANALELYSAPSGTAGTVTTFALLASVNYNGVPSFLNGSGAVGMVNAANDGAAAGAGVTIGQMYRNGSAVMIRVA